MTVPDPVGAMLAMHDTYRMEECEFLYALMRDEVQRFDKEEGDQGGYTDGYAAGLRFAMSILNKRITDLQDRWQ